MDRFGPWPDVLWVTAGHGDDFLVGAPLGAFADAAIIHQVAAGLLVGGVDFREARKAFCRQAIPEGVDDSALSLQVEESLQQIRHYAALAG